jgi:hypothetical protein
MDSSERTPDETLPLPRNACSKLHGVIPMTVFADSPRPDSHRFHAERRKPEAVLTHTQPIPNRRNSIRLGTPVCPAGGAWESRDFGPILRVQYYESLASSRVPSGEVKLLFAVLEDAIRCYVLGKSRHSAANRAQFFDARDWFYEKGADRLFSFESVCAILDIDAGCLRKRLDALEPAHLPLQRFCNRRRLSRRSSRASGSVSEPIREPVANVLDARVVLANVREPELIVPCREQNQVEEHSEI